MGRVRFLVMAGLAGSMVLAGCGDDSGGQQDTGAETTVTTAAVTTTTAAASGAMSGAAVSFTEPADGATVTAPVKVKMQATNFTIEPAGEVKAGAGHFHIIVDADCIATGQVIPKDDTHLHYGMAQTEAELTLAAGKHTLCLQAGDGAHTALDLTDKISIEIPNAGY
ncbi:MAG: DUF4399 domain-containing protein [Acidimicrobiia bacterium]